jgi:predicted O-methyltransferase YrrM
VPGSERLFHFDRSTALEAMLRETTDVAFSMPSEPQTGLFLRTLAASKPAGRFLELGTGTGVATAWLLAGMDHASRSCSMPICAAGRPVTLQRRWRAATSPSYL